MKTFKEFLKEEMGAGGMGAGPIANTVANVQGMQTEPVIRRKKQLQFIRRNAALALKLLNVRNKK